MTLRSPFSAGTITVDYDVLRDVLDEMLVNSGSPMVERERQSIIERAIVRLRWKQADHDAR
jgi:hypothetical protein